MLSAAIAGKSYAGEYEMLFGVSSLADPAAAAVKQLQREFPERSIRLIECPSGWEPTEKSAPWLSLCRTPNTNFYSSTTPTSPSGRVTSSG